MGLICRNGIYYIKIDRDGQRIVKTTGSRDETQAQEFHDRFCHDLWREKRLDEKPKYTWGEAVARWLYERQGKKSIDTDKLRLIWLSKEIGATKPLSSITTTVIERLIGAKMKDLWNGKPVMPATVNRTIWPEYCLLIIEPASSYCY